MMNPKTILLLGCFVVLFTAAKPLTAADEDRIYRKDRPEDPLECTIQKETYTEIVYKVGGAIIKVSIEDIDRVEYSDAPDEFGNAEKKRAEGMFKEAIEDYKRCLAEFEAKRVRPWIIQYALFGIASCYENLGDVEKAIENFESLREKVPDSKFLPQSIESLIRLYASKGQYTEATDLATILEEPGNKFPRHWQLKGSYLQGQIREMQGKYDAAKSTYHKLKGQASSYGIQKMVYLAEVGICRCLIAKGNFSEAEPALKELANTLPSSEHEILAEVFNALGRCAYNRGEAGGGKAAYKEALMAYLRTVVLYATPQTEAEALYYAGLCLEKLERYDQAIEEYKRVVSNYPNSEYATKAKHRISAIKRSP